MYCSKCGKQIKDDSKFCNFCGNKISDLIQKKLNNDDSKTEIIKNDNFIINSPRPNDSELERQDYTLNVNNLNSKAEKKTKTFNKQTKKYKMHIIFFVVVCTILLSVVLGSIGYKAYKNRIENIVPNYYLSIGGSIGTSTDSSTGEKRYFVSVTSEVELYELSIDIYVYDGNELVDSFNYTQKIDLGLSTKDVEIKMKDEKYMSRTYHKTFYGTGKTHEKLPDLDYASVFFMNYDGSVYETMIVEKDYGNIWKLPNNPYRSGYSFEGWYYDDRYSRKFDITEQYWRKKGQNLILYPRWIKA